MGASRQLRTWAAFGALTALLAGCYWTQPGFNSHRTGFNPHEHAITAANAPSLEVDVDVPGLHALEIVRSRAGLLHALNVSGYEITTIDPGTGDVVWTAPVAIHHSGIPTILLIGDVLYVPTYGLDAAPHGCIARYDAAAGTDLGCLPLGGPGASHVDGSAYIEAVASGPWIAVTMSYGRTGGGRGVWLSVVHTTEPHRSWSRSLSDAHNAELGNPVIVGGDVMAVLSVEGSQSVLQRWPLACAAEPCAPATTLTLSSWLGHLIGASGDGTRLAITGNELVEVVDLGLNQVVWSADLPDGTIHFPSSRPTWTPSSLVVATLTSSPYTTAVLRFPAEGCGSATCSPTWTATLPGFAGGQVAAASDILVVSTSELPLAVLPEGCTDPCTPTFALEGEAFWGAPVISDGRIYATGEFTDLEPDDGQVRLIGVRAPS